MDVKTANNAYHDTSNAIACRGSGSKGFIRTQSKFKEKDQSTCQVKQVQCDADSLLIINKETDLHVMKTYQDSYPSGNQKIEGGSLGIHFEYSENPYSEERSSTVIDKQHENSCSYKKEETENQSKENESENERNYEVVLVSDKDLIAKEFRDTLIEKLDHQSITKPANITDKSTTRKRKIVSKTKKGGASGSKCIQKFDADDSMDIISHEACNDSSRENILQRYLCYICGKSYKQLSHLSRHTKDLHSKECFHQCTICNTTFTRAWSLIRHLKLHERRKGSALTEGPFKCPQCTKTFQQPYNVSRHLLTHTGVKPFQCPKCSKTFTQQTGLVRHLIIHKGNKDFKCEVCGKAFARLFVLNRHKLTHTDDKPYKCFECSKSFIRASQLEGHMKSHKNKDTSSKTCSTKL